MKKAGSWWPGSQGEHRDVPPGWWQDAGGPGGPRKFLFDFGDLLEQHIRSEERQLFPAFETLVPKSEAERAGREIKRLLESGKATAGDTGAAT